MKTLTTLSLLTLAAVATSHAVADVLRYRDSGSWTDAYDGNSGNGWGRDNARSAGTVPGEDDEARINFANNTVAVDSEAPAVGLVRIGVDEGGIVEVRNRGVLTTTGDGEFEGDLTVGFKSSNTGEKVTGKLVVKKGGVVDVGRILWSARGDTLPADGEIVIEEGGTINVASHLWLGEHGNTAVSVNGLLNQTGGILGLGTSNAISPSGGTATVTVGDGGVLALNNLSNEPGLLSIQEGSQIILEGTGQLRLPGNRVDTFQKYIDAGKITGEDDATVYAGTMTVYGKQITVARLTPVR